MDYLTDSERYAAKEKRRQDNWRKTYDKAAMLDRAYHHLAQIELAASQPWPGYLPMGNHILDCGIEGPKILINIRNYSESDWKGPDYTITINFSRTSTLKVRTSNRDTLTVSRALRRAIKAKIQRMGYYRHGDRL